MAARQDDLQLCSMEAIVSQLNPTTIGLALET